MKNYILPQNANSGLIYENEVKKAQQELANKNIQRSSMRSAADLAKDYGITYDEASLKSRFDEATKAQYNTLRKEYQATENSYYNNMYNNQQSALDTIRQSQAQAVATGASRGMQSANELSSVLNLQQLGTEGATQLAVDRNALMDKEQEAYAKNAVDALNKSNELGLSLGNLGANIYASDTQWDVANLDYYAKLDAALKNLMGMQEQAQSNRYTADKNYQASVDSANISAAASKYAADKAAAAQIQSSINAANAARQASGGSAMTASETDNFVKKQQEYIKSGNMSALEALYASNNHPNPAAAAKADWEKSQAAGFGNQSTSIRDAFNSTTSSKTSNPFSMPSTPSYQYGPTINKSGSYFTSSSGSSGNAKQTNR